MSAREGADESFISRKATANPSSQHSPPSHLHDEPPLSMWRWQITDLVGGTENQCKEQVPTGDIVQQVHENKQTLPTDWIWEHKSRTIPNFRHLWTSPGPTSISENMETATIRSPSYLELTVWLKCS